MLMDDLTGLLGRFGREGKWSSRGVNCLVRDVERKEVEAGVVEKRELKD